MEARGATQKADGKAEELGATGLPPGNALGHRAARRPEPPVIHSDVSTLRSPSSRGLGRGPFKAKTRVRIPVGTPLP